MNRPATTKFQGHKQPHLGHKKVFDVVRPGKTMASPSGRPIITDHKKAPADDQLVAGAAHQRVRIEEPSDKRQLMGHSAKVAIKPVSDNVPVATAPAVPRGAHTAIASRPEPVAVSAPQVDEFPPIPDSAPSAVPKESTADKPDEPLDAPVDLLMDIDMSDPQPEPKATQKDEPKPEVVAAVVPEVPVAVAAPAPAVASADPVAVTPQVADAATQQPAGDPVDPLLADPGPQPEADELAAKLEKEQPLPPDEPSPSAPIAEHLTRTDIMSGAGMSMPDHDTEERKAVVSTHKKHHHGMRWWQWLLLVLLVITLGLVAFNFVLDAELMQTDLPVPYTNLL